MCSRPSNVEAYAILGELAAGEISLSSGALAGGAAPCTAASEPHFAPVFPSAAAPTNAPTTAPESAQTLVTDPMSIFQHLEAASKAPTRAPPAAPATAPEAPPITAPAVCANIPRAPDSGLLGESGAGGFVAHPLDATTNATAPNVSAAFRSARRQCRARRRRRRTSTRIDVDYSYGADIRAKLYAASLRGAIPCLRD